MPDRVKIMLDYEQSGIYRSGVIFTPDGALEAQPYIGAND